MSNKTSYATILKSSSIIGGAQGINIIIGMIRVKFIAILIGPIGIGLVNLYQSTMQMISSISGVGLQSSAVREIAEATGKEDEISIARSMLTLKRISRITGIFGSLFVVVFAKHISLLTFESEEYAFNITLVSITVLFANIQGAYLALIQGKRRIKDLAKLNIIGVTSGSLISIVLYFFLGVDGIAPAIISMGATQLFFTWWFARKITIVDIHMTWKESFIAAGGMIKLGLAFMWSATLTLMIAYATRALIAREIDLAAVGIFSAAYSLSGYVVNFILGAMAADYYPNLTAVNTDHNKMKMMANQQTEIGLLLAVPGLLGTLALAPLAIKLFYSHEFGQAIELLRWFVLGCFGRIISFPMGYIILAKGKSQLFTFTTTITSTIHIILIWGGILIWGIKGSAIAFFMLYVFHIIFMRIVNQYLIGFTWNNEVLKLMSILLPVIIATFCIGMFLPEIPAQIIGTAITLITSIFCLKALIKRVGNENRICALALKVPILRLIIK